MSAERRAAALLAFGAGVVASYAIQRLIDAGSEPPMGAVLRQSIIPYYWRAGTALVHGLGAGAFAWALLEGDRARQALALAPWLLPAVVLPAMVAMVWVP